MLSSEASLQKAVTVKGGFAIVGGGARKCTALRSDAELDAMRLQVVGCRQTLRKKADGSRSWPRTRRGGSSVQLSLLTVDRSFKV